VGYYPLAVVLPYNLMLHFYLILAFGEQIAILLPYNFMLTFINSDLWSKKKEML
jgi:hypothetical protein